MAKATPPVHDPTALARFGQLDVVTRLVVEGYMIGQHKSPFKGASVEFVEHRQYYPGDEIRHIDWRAYGKTGKYYIKEFEEETNLRCYLLMDASGSMSYGASTLSKFAYGRVLAAAFGYLLTGQRDGVGLMTLGQQVQNRIEPSNNMKNFQLLVQTLEACQPNGEASLGELFHQIAPTLKRRSLVVIISDFFDDVRKLQQAFQLLKRQRHEVILFQVLAPEEEDFPFTKPTQFRSLEITNQRLLVDPHRLRAIYLEQFQEHQQKLSDVAGRVGFDYVKMSTSQPYATALGAFLNARTRVFKGGSSR